MTNILSFLSQLIYVMTMRIRKLGLWPNQSYFSLILDIDCENESSNCVQLLSKKFVCGFVLGKLASILNAVKDLLDWKGNLL